MTLPVLSIVAFAIAIIVSCVSQINVGFLSIAFAFIVGVLFGGMKAADVAGGFPTSLFLILVGVTLFFSQASVNGTLDKIAKHSVKLAVFGNFIEGSVHASLTEKQGHAD